MDTGREKKQDWGVGLGEGISILRELRETYEKLALLESEKTPAIVEQNGRLLQEKLREQESLQRAADSLEHSRYVFFSRYSENTNLKKLTEIIYADHNEIKELENEREQLYHTLLDLQVLVARNEKLLNDRVSLFREIIASLKEESDGYGIQVHREQKSMLIDING